MPILAPCLGIAAIMGLATGLGTVTSKYNKAMERATPGSALIIDQKAFNVLDVLPKPLVNTSTPFESPGLDDTYLRSKPFHIYDREFLSVIGRKPTWTVVAISKTSPTFYGASVWSSPNDILFAQNHGSPFEERDFFDNSSTIHKISLISADAVRRNVQRAVTINPVNETESLTISPTGATTHKGKIIFAGRGKDLDAASALYTMERKQPYETRLFLNNHFGYPLHLVNDLAVSPRNGDLYFVENLSGQPQEPQTANLHNHVFRYKFESGAITLVANDFNFLNGITFAPNGRQAFVVDTGRHYASNFTLPAVVYQFDVNKDGTWHNRKLFAYLKSSISNGIHTDRKGRVYVGCGDGVYVWNRSGKLIGRIYTGFPVSTFQLAGKDPLSRKGRMIIFGPSKLVYVTIRAHKKQAT